MRKVLLFLSLTALMVMAFAPTAGASIHLCSQNPDQQSAQAALNEDPSRTALDSDGDGTACEDFFGNAQQPQAQQSQAQQMQDLPDTGGPSVLLVGGALLMGTGIFGLIALRRRTE